MNQNNIKPQELRATDLRIGNWVKDENGYIGKIIGIESDREFTYKGKTYIGSATLFFDKWNGSLGKWLQTLQPIPLSEEVLLKCGFTKLDKTDYFFIHGEQLNLKVSEDLSMIAWHNLALHDVRFQHLHQLQNLFYSLTQTELEVSWT